MFSEVSWVADLPSQSIPHDLTVYIFHAKDTSFAEIHQYKSIIAVFTLLPRVRD